MPGMKAAAKDDTYLNLSPALVISPKYMILSTTRGLAEDLAELTHRPESAKSLPDNTRIELTAAPIAELIRQNHDRLVARNMLDKGQERSQAEAEIATLQEVVAAMKQAVIRLVPGEESIHLDIDLTFDVR